MSDYGWDIFLGVWAVIATILFLWEKSAHEATRLDYLSYRTLNEAEKVIDQYHIEHARPISRVADTLGNG